MSPLDSFLEQAWNDHADDAPAVAARLPEGLPLVQDDDGVRLAALAHHVLGLGRWQDSLNFLAQLAERGVHGAGGTAAIARCQASLCLCAGIAANASRWARATNAG